MSPNTDFRRICLFLLILCGFAPRALAAFGSCQAGWEWANNSLNQNPCEIAGALEAACGGYSVYVLGPLAQGTNYLTPQKNDSFGQMCNCNSVMYSLYMACTGCQNVTTQTWGFWSQFCEQVYVTQYPNSIPLNTAIPHWAYLNYTIPDKFDPVQAKAAGGLPEEVAPVPSTVSLSTMTTSKTSGSPGSNTMVPISTSTGQGDGNGGNQKKSSHAGAIAGGVIGGLVGFAVIGAGIWVFLRKRGVTLPGGVSTDYARVSTGASVSEHGIRPSPRFYDPSDPSTYPSHVEHEDSAPYTTPYNSGHYTGAAEL